MTPCPVCSFSLEDPPLDFSICPCCGTEFGYHDAGRSYADLRAVWLRTGAKWWSPYDPPPADGNGYQQLIAAGLDVETVTEPAGINLMDKIRKDVKTHFRTEPYLQTSPLNPETTTKAIAAA